MSPIAYEYIEINYLIDSCKEYNAMQIKISGFFMKQFSIMPGTKSQRKSGCF